MKNDALDALDHVEERIKIAFKREAFEDKDRMAKDALKSLLTKFKIIRQALQPKEVDLDALKELVCTEVCGGYNPPACYDCLMICNAIDYAAAQGLICKENAENLTDQSECVKESENTLHKMPEEIYAYQDYTGITNGYWFKRDNVDTVKYIRADLVPQVVEGYVLVPVEPTLKMFGTFNDKLPIEIGQDDIYEDYYGYINPEGFKRAYKAMIEAAQEKEIEGE